jgi:hypothetical protein
MTSSGTTPMLMRAERDVEPMTAQDPRADRRQVRLYVGILQGHSSILHGRAQAFLVEMAPGDTIGAHFHRVDQFQVFWGSDDATYQHRPIPKDTAMVHYADAYTTYGPFSSGPSPLNFFTLRAVDDDVTAYMPGSRHLLARQGRRHHKHVVALDGGAALAPGEVRRSDLLPADSDGLAAHLIEAGSDASTVVSPSFAGGQYCCVLAGEALVGGRTFGARSLAWLDPGNGGLDIETGSGGCQVAILRFPDEPSCPLPPSPEPVAGPKGSF